MESIRVLGKFATALKFGAESNEGYAESSSCGGVKLVGETETSDQKHFVAHDFKF